MLFKGFSYGTAEEPVQVLDSTYFSKIVHDTLGKMATSFKIDNQLKEHNIRKG